MRLQVNEVATQQFREGGYFQLTCKKLINGGKNCALDSPAACLFQLQLACFRNTVFRISLRFPFLTLLDTTYYHFASLRNSSWVGSILGVIAYSLDYWIFPFTFWSHFYPIRLVLSKLKFRHCINRKPSID